MNDTKFSCLVPGFQGGGDELLVADSAWWSWHADALNNLKKELFFNNGAQAEQRMIVQHRKNI